MARLLNCRYFARQYNYSKFNKIGFFSKSSSLLQIIKLYFKATKSRENHGRESLGKTQIEP
jgi:hypothetical protein